MANSISFTSGQYLQANDSASLDLTTITAALWTKLSSMAATNWLLSKRDAAADNGLYQFYVTSSGAISFGYRNSAGTFVTWTTTATGLITTGAWYHIAFCHTAGDDAGTKLYINGIEVSGSWNASTGTLTTNTRSVRLGYSANAAVSLNGNLSNVRLYGRHLSQSEIQTLCTLNEPSTSNLAARWLMDEGSGTTAADGSGNGNTATMGFAAPAVANPSWSTDTPTALSFGHPAVRRMGGVAFAHGGYQPHSAVRVW